MFHAGVVCVVHNNTIIFSLTKAGAEETLIVRELHCWSIYYMGDFNVINKLQYNAEIKNKDLVIINI